jgi:hypothetical protein
LGILTTSAARTFGRRVRAPRMAAATAAPLLLLHLKAGFHCHSRVRLHQLDGLVDVGDSALDWRRCTAHRLVRQPKGIPPPAKLQGNKMLPLLMYVFVDFLLPFGSINTSFQVLFSSIQVLFWQNS